jgi:hypothetical protein
VRPAVSRRARENEPPWLYNSHCPTPASMLQLNMIVRCFWGGRSRS